ncbi:hypothetical protein BYT27DRAFT_7258710 [Phlegmacium glaucopus]|nr:hypothetical protein BYT27DRAFT_7258710 [Phlegmacium glaucopus]
MLNNLAESNVYSSRNAIKDDLENKIAYNDATVFKRLRVDQVDDNFVSTCAASFKANNTGDISILKELVEQASQKTLDDLEAEEIWDKANDKNKEEKSGNHGSAEEKKMYAPLVRLFSYIANFGHAATPRKFQKTNDMLKADEPHTFGFPSCSPDITVSPHGIEAFKSKLWRHRDAFGEVKPTKNQGPYSGMSDTIPAIVTQSADYARLFMSARPFMLFCVGILIFGTEFCVAIFDCGGVTLSPAYDMFEDTKTFVRVVRSIACNLSTVELGFDPTVRVLTDEETQRLTEDSKYPSAVISSCGSDPREWCTIGPPIWTSLSLLGRGTNVWHVHSYALSVNQDPILHGDEMIMKTAWRSNARTSEFDIYSVVDNHPKGLAKFICGGDVRYARNPITVKNMRSQAVHDLDADPPKAVLHRLILGTVGRPLWEYTSESDLLSGFRDAILAHKSLCDQGILHRDISAGNVMLIEAQDTELRGFITDLDFARIEGSTVETADRTVERAAIPQERYTDRGGSYATTEFAIFKQTTFQSTATIKRGAGMTGTAQFMSRRILLQAFIVNPIRVVHEAGDDIESFIWVLSYSVMRNLYYRASDHSASKEVQDERIISRDAFNLAFAQTTPRAIAAQRQSGSECLIFPRYFALENIITSFMSNALKSLFGDLADLIHCVSFRSNSTPLTHCDALLTVVNKTIDSLPKSTK